MLKMILTRIGWAIGTTLFSSLIIFFTIEALPGDMAQLFLGSNATPENLAAFRAEFGLNQPLISRYLKWMGELLQGEFGQSIIPQQPRVGWLKYKLRNTLSLAISAVIVSILTSTILAIFAGVKENRFLDRLISGTLLAFLSVPEFVIGTCFIFLFAIRLKWLPGVATVQTDAPLFAVIFYSTVAILTLTAVLLPHLFRHLRNSLLNTLKQDFIDTARQKGVSPRRIVWRHALPQTLLSSIKAMTSIINRLMFALIIIEVTFNSNGIGTLLLNAVRDRDLFLVRTIAICLAIIFIVVTLLADFASLWVKARWGIDQSSER